MSTTLIGALVPLARPGWVEAGRDLLAGLETAVADINASGGVDGSTLELVVRDTAADPQKATAAVDELAGLGAVALAGEFHSVAARAAAARSDAIAMPFLCSSAVLDALVERPTDWVARLATEQSRGWRAYADFILGNGHRCVAVAADASPYWAAGTRILRDHLEPRGCAVVELEAASLPPGPGRDRLAAGDATLLLLLAGYPEPAASIVEAVRADPRLANLRLGAPAGQPELAGWAAALGTGGAGVPFLRYLPEMLTPLGARVAATLRSRLGANPSFVAFEGYDSLLVLAEALRSCGSERGRLAGAWARIAVPGTRGTIRFSRGPGMNVWQWSDSPVQVVDRDPQSPDRFRVLQSAGARISPFVNR